MAAGGTSRRFRYAAEFDPSWDMTDINQAADQVRSVMMRAGLDR